MILVWALLIGLASFRLWALFGRDTITLRFRERIEGVGWLWEWVSCQFCSGSWTAFAVTWLTDATIGLDAPVLVGLAAAAFVGILGEHT